MNDTIPPGWMPIPHAVDPETAPSVTDALLAAAAEAFPGLVVDDDSRRLTTEAITRLPVEEATVARLWHMFGHPATGLIADLTIAEPTADLASRAGSTFGKVHVQRIIPFSDGMVSFSFVAPDAESRPAILLRAQRREGGKVLTADVLSTEAALLGLIVEDLIRIVGGEIPLQDDGDHPLA